jgi:hypothetical protein
METKPDRRCECAAGRHRPAGKLSLFQTDIWRTHCRDCGCALVRTRITRRWMYSGELG